MTEWAAGWGGASPTSGGTAIVTVGPLPAGASTAIAASGGRVLRALDWSALGDGALDGASVVVAAVPDDTGHGALERLRTLLDKQDARAVIAFEADALDAVAALLMGPTVELLCDPAPTDWAIALALASLHHGPVPAGVREGGDAGERLQRMSEAVARLASRLASLAEEGASPAVTVDDRRRGYGGAPSAYGVVDAVDIRRVIRSRRLRGQFFDTRLLEDPGWDMLLDLFAAELEGIRVSVSSLCIAAAVAPTTALRWISRMADGGLMVRVADTGDRRRAFVALSTAGGAAMRGYVAATKRAGLGLV